MIENDYPIPSYIADVFEKPDGWVETPEPAKPSLLDPPAKDSNLPTQKIYAIDCEMVRIFIFFIRRPDVPSTVLDRGRERTY